MQVDSNVYVSGQIPLVPGCMTALPTGFLGQCQLALDHVMTVGRSMGVSEEQMVTAHCYVYREEDVAYSLGESVVGTRVPKQVSYERICHLYSMCVDLIQAALINENFDNIFFLSQSYDAVDIAILRTDNSLTLAPYSCLYNHLAPIFYS